MRSSSEVGHSLRLACGRFTRSGRFTEPKKKFACIIPCTDTKNSIYHKCLCNFGFRGFGMLYVEVVLFWQTLTFKIRAMYTEMLEQSQLYRVIHDLWTLLQEIIA
jgi:hypothetical protein